MRLGLSLIPGLPLIPELQRIIVFAEAAASMHPPARCLGSLIGYERSSSTEPQTAPLDACPSQPGKPRAIPRHAPIK